tara:strand:- start:1395 stop:1610 length:216 start_codon:yes stop_codon:yes gene_type:complete
MILQTTGLEPLGETWTRSKLFSIASLSAFSVGISPTLFPSTPIRTTLSATIFSLRGSLFLFFTMIFPEIIR